MADIYRLVVTDKDGNAPEELLITPLDLTDRRATSNTLAAAWDRLEAARRTAHKICSVCGKLVETDERGDVLDSSGRCDTCRP